MTPACISACSFSQATCSSSTIMLCCMTAPAFRDWPDASQKRHLLRLWLSMEGDRPLPDCFRQRYGSIEIGNRGGIITKGTSLNVPLE